MLGNLIAVGLGILTWSLAEYFLHRYLGHDKRTWPNLFATEHIRHHSQGDYFAPSYKKALAALAVLLVFAPVSSLAVGGLRGALFSGAFTAMYLTYEWLHRRAHTHAGIGAYGRFLRRHHFHHHFGNPKSNHGVTSPVWDWVFGTLEPPLRVRVPANLAMAWLLDPQTGDVRVEHADGYELVRKRA